MHGIIVADALRVPWKAIEPFDPNHRAKWKDWASVLNLTIDFKYLGPSNLMEWIAGCFWNKRRVLYAIRKREKFLRKVGLSLIFNGVVKKLRGISVHDGQLSDEHTLNIAHKKMENKLEELKSNYHK